jgi:hypothetical protein
LRLDRERCAIVIVGAWNPAIFTPEWMARVVFGAGTLQTQIALGPVLSTMFRQDRTAVTISPVQLQVSPELDSSEPFEETFVRAERAATAILTRLPETPVRAFGINLGFVVDESCALLEAVLLPPDGPALLAAGVRVGATSIVRRLLVDGGIVNLTVTTGETATGRPLRLDFNHHSDTVSSELAIGTIPGALGRAWGISVHLAREVYGIEQVKHEH